MAEPSGGTAGVNSAGGGSLSGALSILKRGDLALALGVILILAVLIVPLPRWMLDMALAASITFSVLILMNVLFISKPLEFNSFPTILLIATMMRLALNVASTRLILGEGHTGPDAAGKVIEAFGQFMMGGNYVIGIIVFAILVLVNFIVITKGSGRIAEVAARFSLDGMPGKQMAIDADLSAGLIDEQTAKERRKELEEESAFFGAMDGAAKFVRGDAIAGLIITFINVIGGIIIGTAQMGLSMGEAAQSYTLLTVGDGLVSQIPALLVSVAAGILVSKAGVAGRADKALFGQLSSYPGALGMSAALLGTMALLPGIPMLPFLTLAGIVGGLAWYLPRKRAERAADIQAKAQAETDAVPLPEEPISTALAIDQIRVELGYALIAMVSGEEGKVLTDQIKALRRELAQEAGFVMPSVRLQDNVQLPANTYVIRMKEIEAGRGELRPGQLLCMDPTGADIALPGESTTEPTFGLPAMWVPPEHREEAHFKNYTVVDAPTVITTHLTELIRDNMAELLSYAETQKLLDELPREQQKLVDDVIPGQMTIGGLQRVLQNLLRERVSVRDLPLILEGISEATANTRNITLITEHVRGRLARQLCDQHLNASGFVPLLTLSQEWEQAFHEALVGDGEEKQLSMPPTQLQEFINAIRRNYEDHASRGEMPVLLTTPAIRPYVRSIVERFRPQTTVMSQNEIYPKARIKTLGQI